MSKSEKPLGIVKSTSDLQDRLDMAVEALREIGQAVDHLPPEGPEFAASISAAVGRRLAGADEAAAGLRAEIAELIAERINLKEQMEAMAPDVKAVDLLAGRLHAQCVGRPRAERGELLWAVEITEADRLLLGRLAGRC